MNIDPSAAGAIVGIAAATLTGISALVATTWRMGTTVAEFKASVARIEERFADFKKASDRIESIPLLERRVESLEKWARRSATDGSSRHWSGGEIG